MTHYRIRPATPADAAGIARVHVDTWRTTYQGIVAEATLAGLSLENRRQRWQEMLTHPQPGTCLLVAEGRQGIVAFTSAGPAREDGILSWGEVYAIYLLRQAQGKGLGRALMSAACTHLLAEGRPSMLLWVLKDNLPARKFYEALGGECRREKPIEIGGQSLIEVAYEWDDIHALMKE